MHIFSVDTSHINLKAPLAGAIEPADHQADMQMAIAVQQHAS